MVGRLVVHGVGRLASSVHGVMVASCVAEVRVIARVLTGLVVCSHACRLCDYGCSD